jgi:integrase
VQSAGELTQRLHGQICENVLSRKLALSNCFYWLANGPGTDSNGGPRGGGRLVARITRDGVALLFQYFAPDGRKRFFPLGPYDATYLRAAYALAIKSKTDPAAPPALKSFGIKENPLASVDAMAQFNKARKRNLNATELAAFCKRLDALPDGAQKDALHLCILLGGQRPVQLLRARAADVDLPGASITLLDGKGRRKEPRRHVIPLTKDALGILSRRLKALKENEPLFSTDETTQMSISTISALVTEVSTEMVKEREAREPFQLRDVRRTAETQLAGLKISSDVRAQVQSHGLGGVQNRHYDQHEYVLEKRAALEKWARHLAALKAGKLATVTPIGGRKGRRDAK